MSELRLSDGDKEDLVKRISDLCERDVLNKVDYVAILSVCKAACERRMKEIEEIIGKPSDIMQ